jgi:hypothetical protein
MRPPHVVSRPFATLAVTLGMGVVAVAGSACSVGETNYATITLPLREKTETRTCNSPFTKPDLGKLEPCEGGEGWKGHCYDGEKIPLPPSMLPACKRAGDVCVSDKLLSAGGSKLKACTFFIGKKPGACVSMLVSDIAENKKQLERDVCDEDERCAPCVHPVTGEDTHLCEDVGVHDVACVGGTSDAEEPDTCCHGMGVCMKEDALPEGSREDMIHDTCSGGELCAPAAMAYGTPVKCDVLGISGVCLDLCFAAALRSSKPVMRGGCGPTEVCLPCIIGEGQGMPGCE